MPPAPRDLGPKLLRLSEKCTAASAATLSELMPELQSCITQLRQLDHTGLQQVKGAYHCGQMALLPLRVLADKSTKLPDVSQEVSDALTHLSSTLAVAVQQFKMQMKDPELPSELVPAWSAAATKTAIFLRVSAVGSSSSSGSSSGSSTRSIPVPVQQLMSTLLQLWHTMFSIISAGAPLTRHVVVPSAPVAAELAVALLTCVREADAAQLSQADFNSVQRAAAFVLHEVAETLSRKGPEISSAEASAGLGPNTVALVSDSVQTGLALHLAVLVAYEFGQQQQQESAAGSSSGNSGGSSRGAATPHSTYLQTAGFPPSLVSLYGDCISSGFSIVTAAGRSTNPIKIQSVAFSGLQNALIARADVQEKRGWQTRCKGLIARAANFTHVADGCLFSPAVNPLLLQLLVVEYCAMQCWDEDGGPAVAAALNMITTILQPATRWAVVRHEPQEVRAVLKHLWLGLGQTLLLASGAAASELADDSEQSGGSSSAGGSGQQAPKPVMWAGLVTSSGVQQLPAGALAQKRYLWSRFSTTLFRSFTWLEVYDMELPTDLFNEQPVLCTRVVEAAARANTEHTLFDSHFQDLAKVLNGSLRIMWTCAPNQLPAETLESVCFSNSRSTRWCSMIVSMVKLAEARAAGPSFKPQLLPYFLQSTTHAMTAAPVFKIAEQLSDGTATIANLPCLAAPAATAWMAASGRVLVAFARLLRVLPAWFANPHDRSELGMSAAPWMLKPEILFDAWRVLFYAVHFQLENIYDTGSAPAAAAGAEAADASAAAVGTTAAAMEVLQQQLETFVAAHGGVLLNTASDFASGRGAAACKQYSAACKAGQFPAALQQLGEAVCAAFPHKFGCNDPACDMLEGLSEASCAVKKCSSCKIARYCCKEHQLRHWPAHKRVCKGLAKLQSAPAGGDDDKAAV